MKSSTRNLNPIVCALSLCLYLSAFSASADVEESSFLPTWKLLSPEQKRTFVAGYLHGWRDAARVTRIVREHVVKNPHEAEETLMRVEQLYDLPALSPERIADGIDEFYKNPDHQTAVLSKAVSFSMSKPIEEP